MSFMMLIGGLIGFAFTVVIGYLYLWNRYDREDLNYLLDIDDEELYG